MCVGDELKGFFFHYIFFLYPAKLCMIIIVSSDEKNNIMFKYCLMIYDEVPLNPLIMLLPFCE